MNALLDPLITELRQSLLTPNCQDVSEVVFDALSAARASVSNIKSATFKNIAHKNLRSCHASYWESGLELQTVQNNFLDIVALEQQCPLWRRLMYGLPEKQLSFLLRAGCDTLPTLMNLARWNIIVSLVCSLCHSRQPTSNNILAGCSTALDQGRYTWCHDSVLQVFVQGLQRDLLSCYKLYADLPGLLASINAPSTVPSSL